MVLLDMMHQLDPKRTRVFTIDTGRLPQETYNLIDRVRDRYEVEVEIYFPDLERVQKMVRAHGMNLFYESRGEARSCAAASARSSRSSARSRTSTPGSAACAPSRA